MKAYFRQLRKKILSISLKNPVSEERAYLILTILLGVASAVVAVGLYKLTKFLTEIMGTGVQFGPKAFLFGALAILVSGYLTTRKFPSTAGSGIPQVTIALAVYHGVITPLATLAKFLTSILTLSSGMSLGREGPTVAICAGIGSYFGQYFHLSKKKVKSLVAVSSAGAISAAFLTPISAVVFTLEEIVGDLNAKILGSIVISSVTATVVASMLTGSHHSFQALNYRLNSPTELIFYLSIGLFAAILGPLWTKTVLFFRGTNLKILGGHRLTYILIAFLITGALSLIDPNVLGGGHSTIEETLLSLIQDPKKLTILLVLKFFATALCYSSGVSGGLFFPTLLIGAVAGNLIGTLYYQFFPNEIPQMGAFALVGMGAYFVAVIRAPFTSILMVFELTQNYNIILPLMIANITSYMLSGKFHKGSIYQRIAEQDGIHLPSHEDNEVLENLKIEDAMRKSPVTLDVNLKISEAYEIAKQSKHTGYPVTLRGKLAGMVSINDIKANLAKGNHDMKLHNIAEKKVISIYPDQSLLVALHKLRRFHVSRLPIVSRIDEKKILGVVTAEDIVSFFGFHVKNEDDDDNIKDPEKAALIKEFELSERQDKED